MTQNKFKVIITKNDNSTVEKLFKTRDEVCQFLDIKPSTLYALQKNTIKLSHSKQKVLENIKIEKLEVSHSHNTSKPKSQPHNTIDKNEYINALLLKV
jgi:hypothetical protein